MDAYHLSPTDGRLADLVGRAEAGENVEIERDGRVVARIVPVSTFPDEPRKLFDLEAYFDSVKDMPYDPIDTVAEMRKQARY